MGPMSSLENICLVVPTLNAAAELSANATVREVGRLVISDGGSTDDTLQVAATLKATVVEGPPGRGGQLAAGAAAAIEGGAQWLLFLHADTTLSPGWAEEAEAFITAPENRQRAAVFRFALDDDGPRAQRLARRVAWRNRVLALPYGDQGLLIRAEFYQSLGGFQSLVLMEDVDIVRRIGRARLHVLQSRAVTSAARYIEAGYRRRSIRNLICLALFFLGLPTKLIARIYG